MVLLCLPSSGPLWRVTNMRFGTSSNFFFNVVVVFCFFLCELVERDECGRGDGFVCSVYYDHVGCACIHVIFYRCSKGPSACLASFLFCLALKTMCFTEYDKQNHSLGMMMMMIIIILLWLTLLLCTYFVITNSFCITQPKIHTFDMYRQVSTKLLYSIEMTPVRLCKPSSNTGVCHHASLSYIRLRRIKYIHVNKRLNIFEKRIKKLWYAKMRISWHGSEKKQIARLCWIFTQKQENIRIYYPSICTRI